MSDETRSDEQQKKSDDSSEKQQKVWTDDEVQKIIKERDAAKKKAQAKEDAEKAALEAKMIEEGKTKELLAQREAELAAALKEAEEARQFKTAKRESLLSKLSDDDKEIAAELSLDKLEKFVEKQTKTSPNTPPSGKFKPGSAMEKPKFKTAAENKAWLIQNGLAV